MVDTEKARIISSWHRLSSLPLLDRLVAFYHGAQQEIHSLELERDGLRAENAKLREALERIAKANDCEHCSALASQAVAADLPNANTSDTSNVSKPGNKP